MTESHETPRPRRRRKFVVLAAVGALGLLVWFAPALASTTWMRPVLLDWLNTSPERRVEFSGVSLSWLRGLQVRDLTVTDAEAPAGTPLLVAKSVDFDVEWWPLLSREVRTSEFAVRSAVLDLRHPSSSRRAPEAPDADAGSGKVQVTAARVPVRLSDLTVRFPQGDLVVSSGRLDLVVAGGVLTVDPIELDVNDGTLRGRARVGLTAADDRHELKLVGEGVEIDRFLAPLVARALPLLAGDPGEGDASGDVGLQLDLTARGLTRDEVSGTLRGDGQLLFEDLEVKSRSWLLDVLRFVGRERDAELAVERLEVPFRIADRRVTTQEVPVAALALDMRLGGHVTLDGQMDYLLRVKLRDGGGRVEEYARYLDPDGYVPLSLSGPVTGPSVGPPGAEALLDRAVDLVRERVEAELGDKLGDTLKGLLGEGERKGEPR
jgi:hypothetical protein